MKKVLIISPHFPPINAADMHRVRQSLPYFEEYGWNAEVITVHPDYIESYSIDELLLKTIPEKIPVHYVGAWDIKKTRKFGLGSLSIRSFFSFKRKGSELLKTKKFDLIYFSTTAFHVCWLGVYWKKRFGIPFVIDMQDPWRSDFYLDKPKAEQPPKFFISYNIDKLLEAGTVPKADGIISVSKGYCDTFMHRYPTLKPKQFRVIPFGASSYDFVVMEKYVKRSHVKLPNDKINIVYIGRGGYDMRFALEIIFSAFKTGLEIHPEIYSKLHFSFIGTSYASFGKGTKTIEPVAVSVGVDAYVTEITDRIPYFETLFLLKQANILLVPGSTDTSYTASKIYPYILAQKPLLAVFHEESSVCDILNNLQYGHVIKFNNHSDVEYYVLECFNSFLDILKNDFSEMHLDKKLFEQYSAKTKTKEQTDFFDEIVTSNIIK